MKKVTLAAFPLFVLATASAASAATIGTASIDAGTTMGQGWGVHSLIFVLVVGTLVAMVSPRFLEMIKSHILETVLAGIMIVFSPQIITAFGFMAPAAGATLH